MSEFFPQLIVRDTDQKLVPLGGTRQKFYTLLDMPGACQKCMMDIWKE